MACGCERIINSEVEVNKGINSCKSLTARHAIARQTVVHRLNLAAFEHLGIYHLS